MTELTYPFATESDVTLPAQAMGNLSPAGSFGAATVPNTSQVSGLIRQAAGYFVHCIESAGYVYNTEFVHKTTGVNEFDDPTVDLVVFIVATLAVGRMHTFHVATDRGIRQSGYWYTANKMLDDVREGKIVLPFSYRNGTVASFVNTESGLPVWGDIAYTEMQSLPEYMIWVQSKRGYDWSTLYV